MEIHDENSITLFVLRLTPTNKESLRYQMVGIYLIGSMSVATFTGHTEAVCIKTLPFPFAN